MIFVDLCLVNALRARNNKRRVLRETSRNPHHSLVSLTLTIDQGIFRNFYVVQSRRFE